MRLLAALLVAGSGCALPQEQGSERAAGAQAHAPVNVIVLFSDDAGYADFGFQPSVEADMAGLTPAIDRIAAEGLTLADFHTSASVCSPSRAGLLSGRYQQEFGHEQNLPVGNKQSGIAAAGRSLAERMRAAGRTTGFIGKWHLGYREEDHPNRVGWDWFYG
ncbi:MAG: sulfatase-like hydrolase/transferase, partial [Planctomycetota bacterium]|nr:sulfatase-like hydrolase/transferase [Planctomycetota bacterium]